MFDLETALATWRQQHRYSRAFKGRDLDELEQHIRDHVALLMGEGHSAEEAFRTATSELGSIQETQSDFGSVAWMKTRDRGEVLDEIRYRIALAASYLRVAFRNLRKNRASTIINLSALSIAISVAMVMYLFASARLTEDYFHENADEIFLVHQITMEEEGPQWWGTSPEPLGPQIADESDDIVRAVRVQDERYGFEYGSEKLDENIRFVDPGFLDMFTFPLTEGSKDALREEDRAILSAETSRRFFGEEDPLGKSLTATTDDGRKIAISVAGVAREFPGNSDIRFEILMGYDAFRDFEPERRVDSWSRFADATFLQLRDRSDVPDVDRLLDTYTDQVNAASRDWQVTGFALDNLKHLTRNRDNVDDTIAGSVAITPIVVLSVLSLLLLLLACFNYMNISIAVSATRLREIGVRKTVGGTRSQLAIQFLTENIELCLVALLVGLFLAWRFTVPAFNEITNANVRFDDIADARFWIFLGGLVLGTGLLSGAYPALFISSFRPTAIFMGRQRLQRRRPITLTFLTLQFLLAFLTLFAGIVFLLNDRYQTQIDLGYTTEHTLVFEAESLSEMNMLRAAAAVTPGIVSASSSEEAIGYSFANRTVRVNDIERLSRFFGVDRNYLSLMGVQVDEGALPGDSLSGLGFEAVVVNRAFATSFGIERPVGQYLDIDSTMLMIAGVVPDFHFENYFEPIRPAVFALVPDSLHRFLTLRVQPGAGIAAAERIKDAYETAFPGLQARFRFQDDAFSDFYEESRGISLIFSFVAFVALLISCMSIYGLSKQNVVNRLKEIGVRRVLGGTSAGIAGRVNRGYLWILSVAAIVSTPLGYLAMDALLGDIYAYRMDLSAWPFLITYAIIGGATALTVSTQIRSINRARPAEIMRSS
jgi:cell division protein FtsX